MSEIDIRKKLLAIHEDKLMAEFAKEARDELKDGIPDKLMEEISSLLKTSATTSNIIAFPRIIRTVAQTELLAAAGNNLGEWFSQPIIFAGVGLQLDARKIIGTNNELDITLSAVEGSNEKMKELFSDFLGKDINILISLGDQHLALAEIYIDESGNAGQGQGKLMSNNIENYGSGNIKIDIVTKQ